MTRLTATALIGPARTLFESWRAVGYTEAQALDAVERSGIVGEIAKRHGEAAKASRMLDESAARQARERAGWPPADSDSRSGEVSLDDIDLAVAEAFDRRPGAPLPKDAGSAASSSGEFTEADVDRSVADAFDRHSPTTDMKG
jgi:hypothetical protein